MYRGKESMCISQDGSQQAPSTLPPSLLLRLEMLFPLTKKRVSSFDGLKEAMNAATSRYFE
jgi:hypothetical protein